MTERLSARLPRFGTWRINLGGTSPVTNRRGQLSQRELWHLHCNLWFQERAMAMNRRQTTMWLGVMTGAAVALALVAVGRRAWQEARLSVDDGAVDDSYLDQLDEAVDDSFPASDAPSHTPVTGASTQRT